MVIRGIQTEAGIDFMCDGNRSEADLAAEVDRLRSLLAEREKVEGLLRSREEAYKKLLGRASRDGFVFDIEVVEASPDRPPVLRFPDEELHFLSQDRIRTKAERVIESGRGLWYREMESNGEMRRWWRVRLVPLKDQEGRVRSILGRVSRGGGHPAEVRRTRKSDQLSQELFKLLPDAVIITDVAGRLLHVNSAGVHLLGATDASQVLGKAIWDMIHPEDVHRARARGRLVQRGEHVDLVEHTLVRLDGSTVPIETLSVPIRYGGKNAVLSTARDISGRKLLEEALSESKELFYKAFQSGPAAYSILRVSDGRILDANDVYADLTGYSRKEIIGRTANELGLWVTPAQSRRVLDEVVAKGYLQQRIFSLQRKDGETRSVLASLQRVEIGDDMCVMSILVDVTDREEAAASERESRELLYRVFHASPAAIGILRRADGRFIEVNEYFCKLTGYDLEEITDKTAEELALLGKDDATALLKQQIRDEDTVQDFEAKLFTKSGAPRTVLVSSQQIQVRGEPCLLIVAVDITERKHVEMELVRSRDRAEEMSRIKTAFLTNMTHEVRTPLTVILGFTSMLRQGVREEYQRFVRVIERSGRRLLLMLDSILDLAQLEAGTLSVEQQVFNVSDVVQNEAELFEQIATEKKLKLEIYLPDERAHARADHKIFVRVLNNLFDNAVKFTDEGTITMRVEPGDGMIEVVVEDTGVGIDTAFLPRVFDEFTQESTGLERTHQGSGLGLAVSKRLLEMMGGSISAESAKGKGSRFVISIPRA